MSSGQNPSGVLLNSWKEIANYLGRGVRTVQRWEHDLDLPVRRPWGRSRSTVMAMSDELDVWVRHAPKNEIRSSGEQAAFRADTLLELHRTIDNAQLIRKRAQQLRDEHHSVVACLIRSVSEIQSTLRSPRCDPFADAEVPKTKVKYLFALSPTIAQTSSQQDDLAYKQARAS